MTHEASAGAPPSARVRLPYEIGSEYFQSVSALSSVRYFSCQASTSEGTLMSTVARRKRWMRLRMPMTSIWYENDESASGLSTALLASEGGRLALGVGNQRVLVYRFRSQSASQQGSCRSTSDSSRVRSRLVPRVVMTSSR